MLKDTSSSPAAPSLGGSGQAALPRGPAIAPPLPPTASGLSGDLGMLTGCLIWEMNFSIPTLALEPTPPLPFTAVRFVIASVLLWIVVRLVEGPGALPPGATRWRFRLGYLGKTFYKLGV